MTGMVGRLPFGCCAGADFTRNEARLSR